MNSTITSWKTSLFGIGVGALNLFANGTNWKQVLLTVGMAGLGLLAKDGNVSNAPQPVAAQKVTGA